MSTLGPWERISIHICRLCLFLTK